MLAFCTTRSLAVLTLLASLWNLYRPNVRFFARPKCKFMSSSFFFSSSSLPKYRRRQSDGRRALNDDGDDEARMRALARPCALLLVRSPCLPPSVKCAPVILSKSRMPKRGFLRRRRDRHSGGGSPRSDDDHLPEAEDGARYRRYRDRGKPFRRVNESCRCQSQCDRCMSSIICASRVRGEQTE